MRVVVRHDLAGRLVVRNHARRRRVDAHTNGLTVDLDAVAKLDALTNMGRLGIDRYAALQNQLLHLKPRPQASLSQNLVKLGRFGHGRQDTLGRKQRSIFLVGIKLTRDHVIESRASGLCRAGGSPGCRGTPVRVRHRMLFRYQISSALRRYFLGWNHI